MKEFINLNDRTPKVAPKAEMVALQLWNLPIDQRVRIGAGTGTIIDRRRKTGFLETQYTEYFIEFDQPEFEEFNGWYESLRIWELL